MLAPRPALAVRVVPVVPVEAARREARGALAQPAEQRTQGDWSGITLERSALLMLKVTPRVLGDCQVYVERAARVDLARRAAQEARAAHRLQL